MNKLLVVTVGGRGFIDLTTIPAQTDVQGRPFVLKATETVKRQITFGQLKTIADLPDNAEDAEWAEFLKDHEGDQGTAIENYRLHLTGEGEATDPDADAAAKAAEEKAKKAAEAKAKKDAESQQDSADK